MKGRFLTPKESLYRICLELRKELDFLEEDKKEEAVRKAALVVVNELKRFENRIYSAFHGEFKIEDEEKHWHQVEKELRSSSNTGTE